LFLIYNGPEGPAPKAPKAGTNPFQPWSFSDTDDFFVAWQGEVDVARNVTLFAAAGYLDNFALFLSPYQEIEDRAGNTTVYPYFQPQTLENFSANAGLRTNFRTGPLKHALRMGWQTSSPRLVGSIPITTGSLRTSMPPSRVVSPTTGV